MKIWLCCVEPQPDRYTSHFPRQLADGFRANGVEVDVVRSGFEDGALSVATKNGDVFDPIWSLAHRTGTLRALANALKEGLIAPRDVVFFGDVWSPEVCWFKQVAEAMGVACRVAAFVHAGSWDPNDYSHRVHGEWAAHADRAWAMCCHHLFFATRYHEDLFRARNYDLVKRCHTVGLPFDLHLPPFAQERKRMVAFPHRLCPEKGLDEWKRYVELMYAHDGGQTVCVATRKVTKTRDEYTALLSRAAVAISFARQETFGYAMLESIVAGAVPIVPNRLSYAEIPIYDGYRYDDMDGALRLTRSALNGKLSPPSDCEIDDLYRLYDPALVCRRMLTIMGSAL